MKARTRLHLGTVRRVAGACVDRSRLGDLRRSERGMSLPFALFGLVTLTILGLGLTGIGMTSLTVASNEAENNEALQIADAGIAHGKRLLLWQDWMSFDQFLQAGDGTACNGDEFSVAPLNGPLTPYPPVPASYPTAASDFIPAAGRAYGVGRYTVALCDDMLTDVDPTTGILDTDPNHDVNKRVLMRSTGVGRNGSTATIEAVIGAVDMAAIFVNGNANVQGNPTTSGSDGAVYASGNMLLSGNPCAQMYFASTGTTTAGSNVRGGTGCTTSAVDIRQNTQPLNPPILNPANYEQYADYKLDGTTGFMYQRSAGAGSPWVLVLSLPGVSYVSSTAGWSFDSSIGNGTYYVYKSDLTMGGSPGSAGSPVHLTIICDGWVNLAGSPVMVPNLTLPFMGGVAVIAGTDLLMAGNASSSYTGLYYALDQINFSGNPNITGQVVAGNQADVPYPSSGGTNLVPLDATTGYMDISGNPTITWSGGGMVAIAQLQWRECRGTNPANPCGPLY
jgi:hypothetical protein